MRAPLFTVVTLALLSIVGLGLWSASSPSAPDAVVEAVERPSPPGAGAATPAVLASASERRSIDESLVAAQGLEPAGWRVIARSEDGQAVAGVTVALWRAPILVLNERGDTFLGRWVSGPDGRVPVEPSVASLVLPGIAPGTFRAELPAAMERGVEWDGRSEGEVSVPVPPTAALAFEVVEGDGSAWRGRGHVQFGLRPSEVRPCDRVLLADGRARFPHVGTGVELPFVVHAFEEYRPVRLTLPPLARDEGERSVRVVLRERYPVGLARFVDESGAPLAQVRGLVQPSNGEVRADDEGRARVVLRGLDGRVGPMTVGFTMQHSSGTRDLTGEVVVQTPLRDGDLALGDVVLRQSQCLVAGRVVKPDGSPWPFVELAVVGRAPDGSWRVLEEVGMSAGDGTILIRADVAGARDLRELALDLAARAHPKLAAPVPFERGQRDVLVTAAEPDSVAGTVRWVGPAPTPELDVLCLRPHGPPLRTEVRNGGTFYFRGLPPGRVLLAVAARGTADPLCDPREFATSAGATTRGVATPASSADSSDWTVGAGLRDLRFTVRDRDPRTSPCRYRTRAGDPFEHAPQRVDDGSYRVLTRAARVDVQLLAQRNLDPGVVEDLRAFEALEVGPEGLTRIR